MADFDPPLADGASVNPASAAANAESRRAGLAEGGRSPANEVPGPHPSPEATGAADDRSGLDRAEEMVDYVAERISSLTSDWGRKFLRLSSRVRESAQDFWAEVEDFRQGKKP
jgi:hypothetical protein